MIISLNLSRLHKILFLDGRAFEITDVGRFTRLLLLLSLQLLALIHELDVTLLLLHLRLVEFLRRCLQSQILFVNILVCDFVNKFIYILLGF